MWQALLFFPPFCNFRVFEDEVQIIKCFGKGALLSKADITTAIRLLLVPPYPITFSVSILMTFISLILILLLLWVCCFLFTVGCFFLIQFWQHYTFFVGPAGSPLLVSPWQMKMPFCNWFLSIFLGFTIDILALEFRLLDAKIIRLKSSISILLRKRKGTSIPALSISCHFKSHAGRSNILPSPVSVNCWAKITFSLTSAYLRIWKKTCQFGSKLLTNTMVDQSF